MVTVVLVLGMILGERPLLKLDRARVARLGAIALVATAAVPGVAARAAIQPRP